jgi:hypothetical protein
MISQTAGPGTDCRGCGQCEANLNIDSGVVSGRGRAARAGNLSSGAGAALLAGLLID